MNEARILRVNEKWKSTETLPERLKVFYKKQTILLILL